MGTGESTWWQLPLYVGILMDPDLGLVSPSLSCRTMSFSISQGLLLLAGLCCLFSGSQPQDPLVIDVNEHDHEHQEHLPCQRISYSIIQLTFTLYQKSESWAKDTNILFSPVNIIVATLMLSLGTKNSTHSQILEGLKFNLTEIPKNYIHECIKQLLSILLLPDHRSPLTIDSSLFTDQSLKLVDKFVKDVKGLYYSKVIAVNFTDTQRAQKQINDYVADETQGKIVGLVKDLEKDTTFALMNYIFFQGKVGPPGLVTSRKPPKYVLMLQYLILP